MAPSRQRNDAMLATLIIVFREVLEAGLIVGIVLAATEGVARRGRWIAGGIAAGVAGAAILAGFAGALANAFSGNGQELFNAAILSIAVVMLTLHVTWMASHAGQMAREMKAMGRSVASGDRSLSAMAMVRRSCCSCSESRRRAARTGFPC
jgi:high-affinity iron transporter